MAANGWLLFRPEAPAAAGVTPATLFGKAIAANPSQPSTTASTAAGAPAAGSGKATPAQPAQIAAVLKELAAFDETDLAGARDRLRALGASEETVFAAIDGVMRINFYRLTRNTEIENIKNGWWRGDPASVNKPGWGKLAEAPFFALMGYDPHDIIDFSSRFDFLPKEKAETLSKIAVDYYGLYLRVAEEPNPSLQANDLTIAERRADVVKLLTPEELAEYDLRFSDNAAQNARRFAKMQASEQEFRTISPLLDRLQQEQAAAARDAAIPAAQRATAQRELEQKALDELVGAVGLERAADFLWTGTNILLADTTTGTSSVISSTPNAPRVLQLASETGVQAAAIHNDPALSAEGKRAALVALQQATQPKLDQLLPPADRANLTPGALQWFDSLARGEYYTFAPRLAGGSATMIASPASISGPPRPAALVAPQIRPVK